MIQKKRFLINKCMEGLSEINTIPQEIIEFAKSEGQKAIPQIAKNPQIFLKIENIIKKYPTEHLFFNKDSRIMDDIPNSSVHLIVTSPPYWTLKEYPESEGQLGFIEDYDEFLLELDKVWKNIFRILVPGGRLVIIVGDVCIPRRRYGRHTVVPLHASIQEHCRRIGFDNLAPIIWYKIANAKMEASRSTSFLGKPYEPNAIIKNDIEYILFQRKSGGYRHPSLETRILSIIPQDAYRIYFNQIWQDIKGASCRDHPAPYPIELAERLIRMFSFVGDTVLDPFSGTGSTAIAAAKWGRNSINFEIDNSFFNFAIKQFEKNNSQLKLE